MGRIWAYLLKELRSFRHARNGMAYLLKDHNFYFHLPAGSAVVIVGILLDISANDWRWLISGIAAVWITESLNTAIEKVTDLAQPEHHPLAGIVKDVAAAAVVMAVCYAFLIGMITIWPYLARLLSAP